MSRFTIEVKNSENHQTRKFSDNKKLENLNLEQKPYTADELAAKVTEAIGNNRTY